MAPLQRLKTNSCDFGLNNKLRGYFKGTMIKDITAVQK